MAKLTVIRKLVTRVNQPWVVKRDIREDYDLVSRRVLERGGEFLKVQSV